MAAILIITAPPKPAGSFRKSVYIVLSLALLKASRKLADRSTIQANRSGFYANRSAI